MKEERAESILKELKALARPENLPGMARYGINTATALGVPIPELRRIAKRTGKDHGLAKALWATGVHEARILASMVDDPALVTRGQMDKWAAAFNSWDLCDQCCANLFEDTPFAWEKALKWSSSKSGFVKRAAFSLMARLAVSDKKAADADFDRFLPVILKEADDDRTPVKKAINWALRQIGKRSLELNRKAVRAALGMKKLDSKSARWIASDALRELNDEAVVSRIRGRQEKKSPKRSRD